MRKFVSCGATFKCGMIDQSLAFNRRSRSYD